MKERGEVCLAEEAERLWRSGMEIDEVSRHMGVDAAWVESVISPLSEHESEEA
jgi:hypothetical protein